MANGEQSEYESKLITFVKTYASNPELQALVTAASLLVPGVAIFDKLAGGLGTKYVMDRLELLAEAIKVRVEYLEAESVSRDYLKTAEWFDIVSEACMGAIRTRSKRKIEEYAKILCAVAVAGSIAFGVEDYLFALSELTEIELHVLKEIFECQKDFIRNDLNFAAWKEQVKWIEFPKRFNFKSDELTFLLHRISKTGLIVEMTARSYEDWGPVFSITDTLRKIMAFINYQKNAI